MGELIKLNEGEFTAYKADPTGPVKGGLVLIHEAWGLVDHIKDVADRFAAEGYLVVAPDLLTEIGMSPDVGLELMELLINGDQAAQTKAQPRFREKLSKAQSPEYGAWAVGALQRTVDYLAEQPGIDQHFAVAGFCLGGSYSFALAAADPRIRAAVPFYGAPPEQTEIDKINCPVLAFYGDQDVRLMESLPAVTAAMSDAGVDFTSQVYAGKRHAFFNDTNPHAYDKDATDDAWRRTLDLLRRTFATA